jgi:hypothetical protein
MRVAWEKGVVKSLQWRDPVLGSPLEHLTDEIEKVVVIEGRCRCIRTHTDHIAVDMPLTNPRKLFLCTLARKLEQIARENNSTTPAAVSACTGAYH